MDLPNKIEIIDKKYIEKITSLLVLEHIRNMTSMPPSRIAITDRIIIDNLVNEMYLYDHKGLIEQYHVGFCLKMPPITKSDIIKSFRDIIFDYLDDTVYMDLISIMEKTHETSG